MQTPPDWIEDVIRAFSGARFQAPAVLEKTGWSTSYALNRQYFLFYVLAPRLGDYRPYFQWEHPLESLRDAEGNLDREGKLFRLPNFGFRIHGRMEAGKFLTGQPTLIVTGISWVSENGDREGMGEWHDTDEELETYVSCL